MVAAATIGGAVASSVISGAMQGDAASSAAGSQSDASAAGIAEQRRQFDAVRELLKPYTEAGLKALTGQQDLIGLNGTGPQQTAITGLQASPAFTSATKLGEDAILANASATGGLRGGNTQAALAQFRPQLLAQLIREQFGNLGGLTSIGQNAAAGVGNAGMATGNNVAQLLQQQGAAQAGGALANGRANAQQFGAIGSGIGLFAGSGGFNNFSNVNTPMVPEAVPGQFGLINPAYG